MATIEEENKTKQALASLLEELAKIKADDLVRSDDLGKEMNFEPGAVIFERTLKLFHDLHESNLDNVSYNMLNNLKEQAKNAFDNFKKIQTFSPKQHPQNPIAIRDQLINTLLEQYNTYFQAASPVIAYSIRKGTDFNELEKNARESLSTLENMKQEYLDKSSASLNQMETTLEKVRQAAAEVGVAQHATHFKDEANDHNRISGRWLIATIITTSLTVVWGIICFFIHPPNDTPQIIQYALAKLIILSALYYTLIWCAKNYGAHRHNYVINKHRQNSLSTFETFVKASGNDIDTKNAVLLQATQSIFSAQPSGYVHKDSETESPNKIIEIMRSVSSTVRKP